MVLVSNTFTSGTHVRLVIWASKGWGRSYLSKSSERRRVTFSINSLVWELDTATIWNSTLRVVRSTRSVRASNLLCGTPRNG